MQKIPLPKAVFENVFSAYDLRCCCGDEDGRFDRRYLPGRFTGIKTGEAVIFFYPGIQSSSKRIWGRIVSTDPIEIEVTGISPTSKEMHETIYKIKEAAAQVPLDIVTE